MTADNSDAQQQAPTAVSETDLNSEIELMKSQDLLEKVVTACGLQGHATPSRWFRWLHSSSAADDSNKVVSAAAHDLEKSMDLGVLPKTSLISVTYEDTDPQQAAHVLDTFINSYMEKHLAVHRPAGTLAFFREQTKQYADGLKAAESRLSEFSQIARYRFTGPAEGLGLAEAFRISGKFEGNTSGHRRNRAAHPYPQNSSIDRSQPSDDSDEIFG